MYPYSQMKLLNLYIVHSVHLENRLKYLNVTISMIKKLAEEQGLTVDIHLVKEPTKEQIEENIEAFNKKVNYDKEDDEQFNNVINSLNVNQISNIEKHKAIYKTIVKKDENNKELHFIIEDDVLIGEDYVHNVKQLFSVLKDDKLTDWDILFTCIAEIETNMPIGLKNSRNQYKFLLSKSSYFIRPRIASKLYEYLEIYKYSLKHGIAKYIWNNKDLKACVLNKHTFLEGSKLGLFTTSVNNSNFLYQNSQFINLARLTTNDIITDEILKEAHTLFQQLEKFENPDVLHTMGVLYYKRKEWGKAKQFMTEACEMMQKHNGYISKGSEILNNAINIYQYDQSLLEECKTKVSKYSAVMASRVY